MAVLAVEGRRGRVGMPGAGAAMATPAGRAPPGRPASDPSRSLRPRAGSPGRNQPIRNLPALAIERGDEVIAGGRRGSRRPVTGAGGGAERTPS